MIGIDAGKIRDVKPFYARQMIQRGEAIDPNMPLAEGGEVLGPPTLFIVEPQSPQQPVKIDVPVTKGKGKVR